MHGHEGVQCPQRNLVEHVVEARHDQREHGLEVGVEAICASLCVANGLGCEALGNKVDDRRQNRNKGCACVLGSAHCCKEAVVDPPDLSPLLHRVNGEREAYNRSDGFDEDSPHGFRHDYVDHVEGHASLADAAQGPVLVGEGTDAPRKGALLRRVAKPLHVEVDASIARLRDYLQSRFTIRMQDLMHKTWEKGDVYMMGDKEDQWSELGQSEVDAFNKHMKDRKPQYGRNDQNDTWVIKKGYGIDYINSLGDPEQIIYCTVYEVYGAHAKTRIVATGGNTFRHGDCRLAHNTAQRYITF